MQQKLQLESKLWCLLWGTDFVSACPGDKSSLPLMCLFSWGTKGSSRQKPKAVQAFQFKLKKQTNKPKNNGQVCRRVLVCLQHFGQASGMSHWPKFKELWHRAGFRRGQGVMYGNLTRIWGLLGATAFVCWGVCGPACPIYFRKENLLSC